jgi:hypothetical protein
MANQIASRERIFPICPALGILFTDLSFQIILTSEEFEQFRHFFWPQVVDYLQDCVSAILKAAIKTIHKITIIYGDEWFLKFAFPHV